VTGETGRAAGVVSIGSVAVVDVLRIRQHCMTQDEPSPSFIGVDCLPSLCAWQHGWFGLALRTHDALVADEAAATSVRLSNRAKMGLAIRTLTQF